MAIRFIADNEINTELEYLIRDADDYLLLISPYIKLHPRLKSDLLNKKENFELKIVVVFGKNENELQKSLSKEDFEFFQQFPNIEIKHSSRLHAKYYASEDRAIFTSMNLYDFSQSNNIEVGIMIDVKGKLASIGDRLLNNYDPEQDANAYFEAVIDQADLMFDKKPKFKSKMLGLSEEYLGSEVLTDKMSEIYQLLKPNAIGFKDFSDTNQEHSAFCIRTGISIPFNIKKPYSENSFKSWERFGNENYKEKFCHFSGEESNGETCFKSPILKKNWRAAKGKFGF